jgi:PAS domain S-box-containing protein
MLGRLGALLFGTVRRQLILGVATAIILLTVGFVAYLVHWQQRFLLERQTEQAFGLARTLAASSAVWVGARDFAGLQELVDAQRRYGNIEFALVTDARGQVLADTDRRQVGRYLLDLPSGADEALFSHDVDRVDAAVPVLINQRLVGWVRVAVGEADTAERMAHIRRSGLLFAFVATLLTTGFAAWLGRRLTKRLDVLNNAMARVEAGESQVQIRLSGTDEAASLAGGFDRMQEALNTRVRQQAAIVELGVHMLESKDLVKSLDEAAQVVASTLGVEFCEILERRSGREELLLHHGVGWKEGLVGRAWIESGTGSQGGYTLQSAAPIIVDDLRSERRFSASLHFLEHNVVSGMSVVILGRGEPFGVLGAHTARRRAFSIDDINFLQAAANVIAAAVEQIRTSRYARSLIEASLDPLVTISADGKITDVNEATVQATGRSRDKLIGSDFADYFTEPEKARAGYRDAFAKGSVKDYELTLRNASGEVMEVLYNATLYRDATGAVSGLFAAARDITELKRDEEELREHRAHLEEMVAARTADLEATNAKLEAANKELETFSYSVSHDLRAPLRAIDGFSRILLEDYADKLDDEGRRVLNVVRDSTVKMSQMIDDILSFSRIGRGEMAMALVDMQALVGAAIKDFETVTAGREVSFEVGPLPQTFGDAPMLQRVWTNLLDNAVKFTGEKPEARIEVGAIPGRGETVYFVRDNGVGFDMQYIDKLFGIFQRLHGAEFAGTGIGLAIIKRIVTRLGGRVWAEGKPNEGATFYFSLPCEESRHD